MDRLLNKVTMITGAASGIGKATALRFYEEGAFVLVTDINDKDGEKLAAQLPDRSRYRHLDVSKEDEWRSVFSMLDEEYSRLDVLRRFNAEIDGTQTIGPFDPEGFNLESWHQVHAINADGVALGCKYAIQLMKKHLRGSIVNISSRSGMSVIPRGRHTHPAKPQSETIRRASLSTAPKNSTISAATRSIRAPS